MLCSVGVLATSNSVLAKGSSSEAKGSVGLLAPPLPSGGAAMTGVQGKSGRRPMLDENGERVHPRRDRSRSAEPGGAQKKGRRGREVPKPAAVHGAAQHGSATAHRLVAAAKTQRAASEEVENHRADADFDEDEDGEVRLVTKLKIPAVVRAQIGRVKINIQV